MQRKHVNISTVVVFFAGLAIPFAEAGSWEEFAVWPTDDDQEAPDVHGSIVVWQQFVQEYGDYDVYVADLNRPDEPLIQVFGDANDQTNPAIYDSTVVWQDYVVWQGFADWDIRMADITDQNDPQLFAVSNIAGNHEQRPAIHGNIVVWQDGEEPDSNIYGADVTDPDRPTEFSIADFELDQRSPAIYRTTVVWQDDFFGDKDVFGADIWRRNKPAEFSISLLQNDQKVPAISGHIVVWEDEFSGDSNIYAADISDPDNPVEFAITTDAGWQVNPDIDGNIVIWQDNRRGDWDIFGYNLTTRQQFQITDNPFDQINPALSGNIVVWQDNRDGNWNIYAAVLDGIEAATCEYGIAGDINNDCKVDFADFAIMASDWLECYLQPDDACYHASGVSLSLSIGKPRGDDPVKGSARK